MNRGDWHHVLLLKGNIISTLKNTFMKPIIIATDFSDPSLNAAHYGADFAKSIHADIVIVHVVEIPATTFQVPMTALEFTEIENAAHTRLEDLQKELIERTSNEINVYAEILYGTMNFEIEKFAQKKKPFAIVVGIKSHAEAKRFFLGSNALRFIHNSLYPVLIIPEDANFKKIKNVAIASDLTSQEESISTLRVKEWLRALHVSPGIIHVKTTKKVEPWIEEGIKNLQNTFTEFSPKFYFINDREIGEGINAFIETENTDLLIVVPEQHGFFENLFQKSDSKEIILHAQLPVLSILSDSTYGTPTKNHHSHSCKTCNGDCAKKKGIKNHIDETHLTA